MTPSEYRSGTLPPELQEAGGREPAPAKQESEIDLLDLSLLIARNVRFIFRFTAAVAVVSLIISLLLPKIYTGTTSLLPPKQQSLTSSMLAQLGALAALAGADLKQQDVQLYVAALKSRTVADALIDRFKLQEVLKQPDRTLTREALNGLTTIEVGRDNIIKIEYEDRDPKRAADVANGYVEELIRLTETLAMSEASQRRLFFEKQVSEAKDALADAEVDLKKVQESTGILEPQNQARVIVENLARLQGLIAAKEVELTAMRSFAAPGNPDLARAQTELAGLRVQLDKLQRDNKMQPGDIMVPTTQVPERALEWVRKMREVKYQQTLFEMLARQYELARVEEAHSSTVIQQLDKAVTPERKSKPKRALIVLISTALGFVAAVVWVFLKEKVADARRDPQTATKLDLLRNTVLNGRGLKLSRLRTWRRPRDGGGGDLAP